MSSLSGREAKTRQRSICQTATRGSRRLWASLQLARLYRDTGRCIGRRSQAQRRKYREGPRQAASQRKEVYVGVTLSVAKAERLSEGPLPNSLQKLQLVEAP